MEARDDTIYLNSKVNEIYATTELTQYFTNSFDQPIELTIIFPIKEEISLSKFVISTDDKIVISKVMAKEKAKEKYNDSIATGNAGFLSTYEENDVSYSVNIGNISPKQQIKLNTIFIEMIGSQDMSYEFIIMDKYPTFHIRQTKKSKKIKPINTILKANIEIKTESKITRLIAPFWNGLERKKSSYSIKYSDDYKTAEIIYIKNLDKIRKKPKNNQNNKSLLKDIENKLYFCLLFRTANMNKPILYTQYNPILKEISYSFNYIYTSKNRKEIPIPEKPDEDNTISYYNKYEEYINNETPGLFIFLIDQSGSMAGKSIDLVKKALLLFIQSLAEGSYFQIIGFGSKFIKYNDIPVIYDKQNVTQIIDVIKDMKANLGGTNISKPLENIFNHTIFTNNYLSRNIFLLTDGQVHDRDECFKLISENSNKYRIQAIGIGNDFDKILIEQCGKLGKGSSSFVKNVENINSVVIESLNKCLRPYISNVKFIFENFNPEIESNILLSGPTNNFSYQNEIINYSFILPGDKNLSNLNLKITGKDPVNQFEEQRIFSNVIKLEDGEEMSKMIVGKALKTNNKLLNDEKKEIEFAKKYQILSKNTALFAELSNVGKIESKLINININEFSELKKGDFDIIKPFNFSKKINRSSFLSKKRFRSAYECSNTSDISKYKGKSFRLTKYKKRSLSSIKIMEKSLNRCRSMKLECLSKRKVLKDKKNIPLKVDITNLILSQDIIEGWWNENNYSKKIINDISLDKFNKIKSKVNALYKGVNSMKIIYTIIVIYYIELKFKNKLKEYRLVLNKANKYLEKNGINYKNIISSK